MSKSTPQYCSVLAQDAGFDPIGMTMSYDTLLVIELPLPWPYNIYTEGKLPPPLATFLREHAKAHDYRFYTIFVAPDPEYSQPGMRRIMRFRRPDGPMARFDRDEYLVPEAALAEFVMALATAPELPAAYVDYRQATADDLRDLLVCTHGAVDAACAKFGFPAYGTLRKGYAHATLRVWRTSHFGGHVCAPTLLSYPDGRAWAYIGAAQAPLLAHRQGDPQSLYSHYRGWAGVERRIPQVIEREIWMREGWSWFECQVSAQTLAGERTLGDDDDAGDELWGEVRVDYVRPNGERGYYLGRAERSNVLNLLPSTKYKETHTYPQYQVTRLEHVVDTHVMAEQVTGILEMPVTA